MRTLRYLRTYEVALEKAGLGPVAGVDEAGRGACAGPISIAACVLPPQIIPELARLTDSKKLSPRQRAILYPLIKEHARAYAIVHIPAAEIDRHGIQHANISGMRRAVAMLQVQPGFVLTDAMRVPGLTCAHLPMVGGDLRVRCIAAASVLAKHSRDLILGEMGDTYPEYGFAAHKGYGTKAHMDAVRLHGGCPEHRYSYANVAIAQEQWEEGRGQ